jgi:hypothetical protein
MKAIVIAVVGLLSTRVSFADDVKCDPASKKIEWHMCHAGPVEYKKGMKKESRTECMKDTVVKAADGCKLGNILAKIPEKLPMGERVFFYGVGPKDMDFSNGWETQIVTSKKNKDCTLGYSGSIDEYQLMKFGDAMDKDNRARSEMVREKLKKAGKRIVGEVSVNSMQPEYCGGHDSQLGVIDRKTSSKYLLYVDVKFVGEKTSE